MSVENHELEDLISRADEEMSAARQVGELAIHLCWLNLKIAAQQILALRAKMAEREREKAFGTE